MPGRHSSAIDEPEHQLAPPAPPSGWYTDPTDVAHWRFWSGEAWAEFTYPRDPVHIADYLPAGESRPTAAHYERQDAFVPLDSPVPASDLRSRIPAQSVIEKLVELQSAGELHEMKSWHTGAVGERHVADILALLGPEWTVLHSVPVGVDGSDIDHIVIGPPGVFTLNTKHHPGKTVWVAGHGLRVNNRPHHYLNNAAHEAARAERLLSDASGFAVDVVGLIVIVGATLTVKARPETDGAIVGVITDKELLGTLNTRRAYSDAQVARIADAAARPGTWSPVTTSLNDTSALLTAFDLIDARLHADVTAMRPASAQKSSGTRSPRPRTPIASASRPARGPSRGRKRRGQRSVPSSARSSGSLPS